jgi:hypothetical protein
MSLVRKLTRFAASPQGRRAIDQARTKLDTPENRRKLTDLVGRARGGTGSAGGAAARPPRRPER